MKNKKLLTIMGLASCLSFSTKAEESINDYPVSYNNCNLAVNLANIGETDGAIPRYYMSRDCKTLYLMPPAVGTIEADVSITQGNIDRYCSVMKIDNDTYKMKNKRLRAIEAKLLDHEINGTLAPAQVARLERNSSILRDDLKGLVDKFSQVEGGRAYLRLEAGVTQDYFADFVLSNQHLVHKGVKIVEMEIDKGFLSVPKAVKSVGPAVIGMSVSGQPAQVKHENEFSQTYMMQKRAGAQIVFGLGRACELAEKIKNAERQGQRVDSSEISRMFITDLAPNYFYQTSVSSIASYTATLDSKDFVRMFYERHQEKAKFSHKNIEEIILNGNLIAVTNIVFDEGRALSDEDRAILLETIHKDVTSRFSSVLIEKLKSLSLVEDIKPDTDLQAPSGSSEARLAGHVRRCSKKKFMGVTYSKSCRNVPVYKTVYRNGKLTQEFIQEVSTSIHLEENYSQNGFYPVFGSANFKHKGGRNE